MKKLLVFLLVTCIFLTSLVQDVNADGMIVPPDYYPVYETRQKAFIIYEDNHEDLVVSISFDGEAYDFGWIIPLPNQPDISKVDYSIFRKLSEETEPKQNILDKIKGEDYYYNNISGLEMVASEDYGEEKSTVQVIEEDSIGIFDYAVLKAEEPEDLKEWMEENDYNLPVADLDDEYWIYEDNDYSDLPQTQEEAWSDALPIIQDYIDSDWYFVTVKISNKFEDSSGVESQLEEGAVDPLRFSFETTDMIYPMKLTGLSKQSIGVTLYVIDDHKVKVSNYDREYCSSYDEDCSYFNIEYAGKIKKDEIEDLTSDVGKGSWYSPEETKYITKLYASNLSYEYMDEEVLFEDTKNNRGVNDGTMSLWEWIQLPFVVIIYLPYYILGGFFDLLSYGSYGYYYGFEYAWLIGILALLFIGSIVWIIISTLLLKKTKKRIKRVLLYLSQFPSVWLTSVISSLIIVIPFGYLIQILSGNDSVMFIDSFCCLTFVIVILPLVFYRILWKMRKKKSKK